MNYYLHYTKLITRRVNNIPDGYVESHHIIPRCMGGTNDKKNLVCLTAEEHYTAHLLLVKMYPDNHKLIYAADMMCVDRYGHRLNNKSYGWIRRKLSELRKNLPGIPRSEETKSKISLARRGTISPNKGKTISNEAKLKMSISATGKKHSEETKLKIGLGQKGKKRSDETKLKMSISMKNYRLRYSTIICPAKAI